MENQVLVLFYYPSELVKQIALPEDDYTEEEKIIVNLLMLNLLTLPEVSFAIVRLPAIHDFIDQNNVVIEVKTDPVKWFVIHWRTRRVRKLNT